MRNALIGLCLLILMFCGCKMANPSQPGPNTGYNNSAGAGSSTTVKVDWLFSLFMVGAVVGIIAGFGGFKFGWVVALGNVGGIVLSLMVAEFGRWLALGGCIAAICVVVAMLIRNRQFQFQSVQAVQELKMKLPELKDQINETFWKNQNRVTENLVGSIKSVLKKKEEKQAGRKRKKEKERSRLWKQQDPPMPLVKQPKEN